MKRVTAMKTVDAVLKKAVAEIGCTETPANSNRTKYGKWYGMDGNPWCMMFVQWCCAQAGAPLPCKTASCFALLRWYTQNHPECIVSTPQPGDIVIYNFGHTGILESANSKTITVIEGNTSPGNSGSQSNGGGVYRRTRKKSTVTAYIRPFMDTTTKEDTMTGNEIISALTDEQAYDLLLKAQRYAATLPEPAWSVNEGHWQTAKANGTINGDNPEGLLKRDEFTAVLGRKGLL